MKYCCKIRITEQEHQIYLHSSEVLPHFVRDSRHEGKLWH